MYFSLKTFTDNPDQDIWIGDEDGALVQKEMGCVTTSLLPGKYTVSFGIDGKRIPIDLDKDSIYTKEQLEDMGNE